jgi:hypothetical protein
MLLACTTVESENATTFGTAPSSADGSASQGVDTDDTSDSDDTDEGDTASTSGTTTGASDPSDDDGTTMPTTQGSSGPPGDDDGVNDDGNPPGTGMYSHCLAPEQCPGGAVNVCMTIGDNLAGFCTNSMCTNPAVDCDPSPGGTAEPMCAPTTLNNQPAQVCALDCSAGKTCPVGMQCWNLEGGVSLCAG